MPLGITRTADAASRGGNVEFERRAELFIFDNDD
jgi:hypothetical protein